MSLWPFARWPWRHPADVDTAREALADAHRDRVKVEKVVHRAERLSDSNGFGAAILKAMTPR